MRYIFILITILLISGCRSAYVEPTYKEYDLELNAIDINTNQPIIDRNSKEYKEKSEARDYHKKEYDSSAIEGKKDQELLNHVHKASSGISNALEQY